MDVGDISCALDRVRVRVGGDDTGRGGAGRGALSGCNGIADQEQHSVLSLVDGMAHWMDLGSAWRMGASRAAY